MLPIKMLVAAIALCAAAVSKQDAMMSSTVTDRADDFVRWLWSKQ